MHGVAKLVPSIAQTFMPGAPLPHEHTCGCPAVHRTAERLGPVASDAHAAMPSDNPTTAAIDAQCCITDFISTSIRDRPGSPALRDIQAVDLLAGAWLAERLLDEGHPSAASMPLWL